MTGQDDTREALDASGYAEGDLFPDEDAVYDYFSPFEQRLMFGDDAIQDEDLLGRMADLVIAERLHMVEPAHHDELHRLAVELARVRQARDDAIRAAVADGMSYREVAAAIGLSHGRVAQIVTSDPRGDA